MIPITEEIPQENMGIIKGNTFMVLFPVDPVLFRSAMMLMLVYLARFSEVVVIAPHLVHYITNGKGVTGR